jgi:hypothetical protein
VIRIKRKFWKKCESCGARVDGELDIQVPLQPWQRKEIRQFKQVYPWVSNESLAALFGVSTSRMSEIIRADVAKRGL